MTTVIVPLDGSAEAEMALPHARQLAGPDGLLLLVTAVWHGEPLAPRRYFEDRALALAGEPVDTKVVLDERPSVAIGRVAEERPGAVVCMATHGRNAFGQALLGSTAEAVVRGIDRPVVLVGPRAAYDLRRADAHNLVVAVDGAATADRLVPVATKLADRHHLALWAIEALPPAPYPFVADAPVAHPNGEATGVTQLAALLEEQHRAAGTKVVYSVDPADAVVHFAVELPATYVLLASHARSGLARWALGSVAMRVVHRSPCPVVVVPR